MFYLYFTKNVHLNQNVCWPCVAFLYFHVMWHTMVKLYNKLEIVNNKLFLDVFFLHKLHKHTENCWKIYIFDFQTKLYSSLRDSWNQTYSSYNFIGTKFMGTICKSTNFLKLNMIVKLPWWFWLITLMNLWMILKIVLLFV